MPISYKPGSKAAHALTPRLWRVLQRNGNASAFNGYHWQASDYSAVQCLRCGAVWRTKADYVVELADRTADECHIMSGFAGHADAMAARGRSPYQHGESS